MHLLCVPSWYDKKTEATSLSLQQILHTTNSSTSILIVVLAYCTALPFFFSWMAFCLSRCNFIWKSASAALGFLPAYCSRYLLSYLWFYGVETHGIIYYHYKIFSSSVIHFATAIKNILFLAILLSVLHKNLQTTTFITASLSITYQLHAAVQNLFSQRALSYRK